MPTAEWRKRPDTDFYIPDKLHCSKLSLNRDRLLQGCEEAVLTRMDMAVNPGNAWHYSQYSIGQGFSWELKRQWNMPAMSIQGAVSLCFMASAG